MEVTKYPPLTTATLVNYSHLGPFSEVVPAEKMAELERKLEIGEHQFKTTLKELIEKERLLSAIMKEYNINDSMLP